jgi:hypothetical protein
MRCRDGRLQYPGYLSFFMIAVPMTIILLHAAVGEAIIDAVIPAVYSGILTLGAFLYSKSLAALLITFCVAIAALNYWGFVYRPASIAHTRRKNKLRRLQYEGHSTSKVNRQRRSETVRAMKSSAAYKSKSRTQTSYFRRLFNNLKRSIQHGVTLMSYRRIRSAKQAAIETKWCGMNRPSLSVSVSPGSVRGSDDAISTTSRLNSPSSRYRMSPDGVTSFRRFSTVSSIRSVPGDIINMLAAVSSPTRNGTERKRKESIYTSPSSTNYDAPPDSSSEHVVTRISTMGNRKAITPYLLLTFREAINFLRSRLSLTYESPTFDVPEKSLSIEFKQMLETFYPDGVALSSTERAEAFDQFNDWKETIEDNFILRVDDKSARTIEIRMIDFGLFEEWFFLDFASMLQNSLQDRLMVCSLRNAASTKKRQLRVESSLLSPESQGRSSRSISFLIPQPLVTTRNRVLSVTPDHLFIPFDAESKLI